MARLIAPALIVLRMTLITMSVLLMLDQPADAADDLLYVAQIVGVDDAELQATLEAVSHTLSRQESPPTTRRVLDQRLQDDVERLSSALRSEGFYQGKVKAEVADGAHPLAIRLVVDPGPPFVISDIAIRYILRSDGSPAPAPIGPAEIDLKVGDRARAGSIVDATQRAINSLRNRAYPFAAVVERKVLVDHSDHTVSFLLRIDAGPMARFGAVKIEGLRDLDSNYVRRRLGWSDGSAFDQSKLDEARRTLMRSGLFASVKVARAAKVDSMGRLPVTVTAEESPARSIGGGASYSTDLGPGIKGFWEHRNLLGGAERISLSTALSTTKQGVEGRFNKPDFPTGSELLLADADISAEELDAFDSRVARAAVRLEHSLAETMTITGGLGFELSDITSQGEQEQFSLASMPFNFAYDTSDALLEPTRGHRLDLGTTPYSSVAGESLNFAVTRVSEAAYWSPGGDGSIVLAGRATFGSLVGADTDEVPANKRLYAGGGGSVRGYAFQSVGPLDGSNDPLGGRSLIEFSVEARFRLWDSYGIVPFLDAGNVYDSEFPDLDGHLQWGGGLGLRYYTPIGPVRLDLAVPLNRRKGIDDNFQVYISVGQAF